MQTMIIDSTCFYFENNEFMLIVSTSVLFN